jgi:hypothetical protein
MTDDLSHSTIADAMFVGFALKDSTNGPYTLSAPLRCFDGTIGYVVLEIKVNGNSDKWIRAMFTYMIMTSFQDLFVVNVILMGLEYKDVSATGPVSPRTGGTEVLCYLVKAK